MARSGWTRISIILVKKVYRLKKVLKGRNKVKNLIFITLGLLLLKLVTFNVFSL